MTILKNFYQGPEFKFTDYFNSKKQGLIDDFLRANKNFFSNDRTIYQTDLTSDTAPVYKNGGISTNNGWKNISLGANQDSTRVTEESRDMFPTAFEIMDNFGLNKRLVAYIVMEPMTILKRHTGLENRDAKFIRIHVPLIIPEGDIGFEVSGEEIFWTDVFAFNNQKPHSVWNLTNERRVVFLIDLTREICELPPAPVWFPGCNDNEPGYDKTDGNGELFKKLKEQGVNAR